MADRFETRRGVVRGVFRVLNVVAFTFVLLWSRRYDSWIPGLALFVWSSLSAALRRWFEVRVRRRSAAGSPEPRRPAAIATPAPLRSPPPRTLRGRFAARAARRYRSAYPGLLLLPLLLGLFWYWRRDALLASGGLAVVLAAVLLALVVAAVLYVESNVRAVQRLVREGSVSQGSVSEVNPLRNKTTVRFSFAGALLQVSVPHDDVVDLEPGSQLPVLVTSGSTLVGIVDARDRIAIARCAATSR